MTAPSCKATVQKGRSPSLASCDLPSWTPLPLLALESLLPLTVVSCFACFASVSCTGFSSSGFLCVETNQGQRDGKGRQDWTLGHTAIFKHTHRCQDSIRRIMEPKISQHTKTLDATRSTTRQPAEHTRHNRTTKTSQTKRHNGYTVTECCNIPATEAHKHPDLLTKMHDHIQYADDGRNTALIYSFMIDWRMEKRKLSENTCRTSQRPHLLPDEVRDVRGSFGRRGDVGGVYWALKGAGHIQIFTPRLMRARHKFKDVPCHVFTWLAVPKAEDDDGPPFSHRNADEVDAPPWKKGKSLY